MTTEHYKDKIAAGIANNALNAIIAELAAVAAERDALKTRVEELEKAVGDKPAE